MQSSTLRSVAIIGSGPSGCYLAQSLRKQWPDAEITLFDRLVSPYGLVRYGVAADHQHTKAITRQFERLFAREGVRFAGNVEIGSDVTLDELRNAFSVVVLATGIDQDQRLGIEGDHLPQIYGAGRITRLFNSHPMTSTEFPELGESTVIVGGGNVAVDIARLLVKAPEHYVQSDVDEAALGAYTQSPARTVTLVSRSGLAEAKADAAMLKELGKIPGVRITCTGALSVPEGAGREALARAKGIQELPVLGPTDPVRAELRLIFGARPSRIVGEDRVTGVDLTSADETAFRVEADSVITAIGFDKARAFAELLGEHETDPDDSPRLAAGLYRAGWLRRGPRGAIPENRSCAISVAEAITADFRSGEIADSADHGGYAALPHAVRAKAIDFAAWQRLDAAEIESAGSDRVRRKTPDHGEMYRLARGDE